jgi:K+-sensing histidine kinase KdpD
MLLTPPPAPDLKQRVRDLAPTELSSARDQRYDGSGFDVSLERFSPSDQANLRIIYETVKKAYELWLYMREAPNHDLMARHLATQFHHPDFINAFRSLGAPDDHETELPKDLRKVLHDVRGGALVGLNGYASLLDAGDPSAEERMAWTESAVLMARDHAKLMRNALVDIDPLVREADEGLKVHYIDDFVRKWQGARLQNRGQNATVSVQCDFEGSITNRCLETSAIDRVLYNYLNNATRFTADERVELIITPINDALVRWVVTNPVSSDQFDWLQEHQRSSFRSLFEGGLTRGGQGIGLSNCVDFVAKSCGRTPAEALDAGYLGAALIGNVYHAWFHWPSFQPGDETLPDCAC